MSNRKQMQICWDCAKATGGCDWSREYLPIPGWEATPAIRNGDPSYVITGCPEFVRDSWGYGSGREPPLTAEERAERDKRYLDMRRRKARERYERSKQHDEAGL